MVMESQHGSKADSETAQDVFGLLVRYGKQAVQSMIDRDLVRLLVERNFGREALRLAPCSSLNKTEHQDFAANATAVSALYKDGYLVPSQLKDTDAMLGLTIRTEEAANKPPTPSRDYAPVVPGAAGGPGAAPVAAGGPGAAPDTRSGQSAAGKPGKPEKGARNAGVAQFGNPDQPRDENGRWGAGGGGGDDKATPAGTVGDTWLPKSRAENVAHGAAAMKTVIEGKTDVENAMWREDVGHISFLWGQPGQGKDFSGGYGVSHIIAKHGSRSQPGENLAQSLVHTLDRGTVDFKFDNPQRIRIEVRDRRYTVVLNSDPERGGNSWLVTGFVDRKNASR